MQTESTTISDNPQYRMVRQGDVLLRPFAGKLPEGAKQRENPQVLQQGTATGHSHRLTGPAEWVQQFEVPATGQRFLLIEGNTDLVHEEHDPIFLGAGLYEIVIHSEFDGEAARQVMD